MSKDSNNIIIEQLAETQASLESIENLIAELSNKIKPEDKETHKLLNILIEEFKKPCHITLKLK